MVFFLPNSYIIKLLNVEIQYKKTPQISAKISFHKHTDNDNNKTTIFRLNSLHY